MTAVGDVAARSDEELVARKIDELLAAHPPARSTPSEFLGAQFDAGLAFVHFPEGYGGLGLSRQLQAADRRPAARRPAPRLGAAQPDRVRHGRPDHPGHRHRGPAAALPPPAVHLRGDLVPAVLRAGRRLRRRQPGHPGRARRGRVGPQRPEGVDDPRPHAPASASCWPGPTPRPRSTRASPTSSSTCTRRAWRSGPLRQMTGDAEFNEVFFTDVRIPDAERLGDVGDGWRGALVTLMNERVSIGGAVAPTRRRSDRHRRAPLEAAGRGPAGTPPPGTG